MGTYYDPPPSYNSIGVNIPVTVQPNQVPQQVVINYQPVVQRNVVLGNQPVQVTCPKCRNLVVTNVFEVTKDDTECCLCLGIICILLGLPLLACISCCCGICSDTEVKVKHYCPNCRHLIGTA